MNIFETKTWKVEINPSHDDCGEYSCNCKEGKGWRMWLKNKISPINSAWREFASEADAIKKALAMKPELIAYDTEETRLKYARLENPYLGTV